MEQFSCRIIDDIGKNIYFVTCIIEKVECNMEINIIEFGSELQKSFREIQKNIQKISYYNFGLGYSDKFQKDLNNLFKEMRQVDVPQLKLQELNEALQNTVHGINNKINISINDIEDVSKKLSEAISSAAGEYQEEIRRLGSFDFSSVFVDKFINSGYLKESIDTAYEIAQDKFSETEGYTLESSFSSAEELEEAVNEHINNPKGFQERLANWSQKKKIQYFIIWQIICILWSNFCQPYFQENIGIPVTSYIVSKVKELPEKGAKVICQLKQNVEAIILENASYYYKVSFIDEDGNVREGYVAKKNLKILNKEEDVEEDKEKEVSDGQE